MTEISAATWVEERRSPEAEDGEDATTFPGWITIASPFLRATDNYAPPQERRWGGAVYISSGRPDLLRRYDPVDTASGSVLRGTYLMLASSFQVDLEPTVFSHFEQVITSAVSSSPTGHPGLNVSEVWQFLETLTEDIEALLDRLFVAAQEEQFEPGIESGFAEGLDKLFRHDPYGILSALKACLASNEQDPEVLAEMLRWAGCQEALNVREAIIDLLSVGLNHSSSIVRDAAALGLGYLRDPVATSHLKRAIEKEPVPELRQDLEDLVNLLEP